MKKLLLLFSVLMIVLVSCQKEIDWGVGGGGTNGDLLVKALEITPATNDTNVVTFQWDANKRLLVYRSAGKVNGTVTDILYTISRLGDGKISKIVYKSSLFAGFVDSVVYEPHYLAASGRLSYVIDTQFTIIGTLIDSSAFTYNASGQVSSKESFIDFFGMTPTGKETYTYDANGNVPTLTTFSPDGAGGWDLASTVTSTFDSHKTSVVLGEESYIILGATNVSKNNATKVDNSVVAGNSYTGTYSQQQFNSFNRPTQSSLSVTPQPPGYDLKLLFYYQ